MSNDSHHRGPGVRTFVRSRPIVVLILIVLCFVAIVVFWAGMTNLSAPDKPSREHTGVLSAEVVDAQGKPVAGAKVVLTDSITKENSFAEAGGDGRGKFAELFPGNYEVHAEKGDIRSEPLNIQVGNNAAATVRLVLVKK